MFGVSPFSLVKAFMHAKARTCLSKIDFIHIPVLIVIRTSYSPMRRKAPVGVKCQRKETISTEREIIQSIWKLCRYLLGLIKNFGT
jgi:hypothetical protein